MLMHSVNLGKLRTQVVLELTLPPNFTTQVEKPEKSEDDHIFFAASQP